MSVYCISYVPGCAIVSSEADLKGKRGKTGCSVDYVVYLYGSSYQQGRKLIPVIESN